MNEILFYRGLMATKTTLENQTIWSVTKDEEKLFNIKSDNDKFSYLTKITTEIDNYFNK